MKIINIYDAKAILSKLIADAMAGKEVVIAKNGSPVVQIIPYVKKGSPRKLGTLKGKIKINDDFNDPLPDEVLKQFGIDTK